MHKEMKRSGTHIGVGSTVTLAVLDREGESLKFTVMESGEADPRRGWISREAPIARAVIGKQIGDEIAVSTPRAMRHYQIVGAT